MKHLKYLKYLVHHKFWVMAACLPTPSLWWRGIIVHDLSKLRPSEWAAYAESFYGSRQNAEVQAAFDLAWLHHQKRNDHHWQWWVLREEDGGEKVLPMSTGAREEMLRDWCGASLAQGYGGWEAVQVWYEKNQTKMQLHPSTRQAVVAFLAAR